jgi:hypothetical protein
MPVYVEEGEGVTLLPRKPDEIVIIVIEHKCSCRGRLTAIDGFVVSVLAAAIIGVATGAAEALSKLFL